MSRFQGFIDKIPVGGHIEAADTEDALRQIAARWEALPTVDRAGLLGEPGETRYLTEHGEELTVEPVLTDDEAGDALDDAIYEQTGRHPTL